MTQGSPQAPEDFQFAPRPGDDSLIRAPVFIDSTDLRAMESYPRQFVLNIQGSLPTPCNQLRAMAAPPDDQNRIEITVYSVVNQDRICAQVLSPFEINLPLGSFLPGKYEILVNGNTAAELIP